MTRINCIPVADLTRQHLVAEYRELPRVFSLVKGAEQRGETPDKIRERAPAEYTLGPGHGLFFYTRLAWLVERYNELVAEMLARGYNPTYLEVPAYVNFLDRRWFGEWTPSDEEIARSQARIDERLSSRMTYKNKPGERKKPHPGNEWDFL